MARSTDGKGKLGGLFDDLSMAQVVAGALAAVTSMLLASQIGIYGSVIGVGVGSVVSAVASQLYKKFLAASAEKLRELKPGETGYVPSEEAENPATTARRGRTAVDAAKTARLDAASEPVVPLGSAARRTSTPRADDAALQGDPSVRKARERRDRKKKVQRGVVVVSVVSAIAAVAVSAVVIDLATTGQGVGAKTPPLVAPQEQKAGGDAESAPDASKDAAPKASKDPAKDASSNGSSNGDASSNAGNGQGSSGSSGSTDPSGGSQGEGGSTEGGQPGSGSQDPASKPGSDGSSSGSGQSGSNQSGSGSGSSSGSSSGSTGGSASGASSGKAATQAGTALPVARA
ncbi:hypothetical protein [Gordonibacter massiliensis (ex Traore et al. 2017)]|uniref:Uncharacterized protein n=1 Tax=Gordonibacter massiliensis (ex Traore et al. 2017) TaxID=1841863 RepID=A0A842JKV5_9ACTN|nr:hypothetical protein [Gordonibacter massiliensis (ex Traore et al. 2017)]MBC2889760.1 hypothetical protein [Gordonibacter massiliensis (ex Traore et al. 2017)]